MKTIINSLIIGAGLVLLLGSCSLKAQEVNVTNAVTAMPSFSQGLQMIYDSATSSTNFGIGTGFLRSTHGNRNVGFAELTYNFNGTVAAIIGYDAMFNGSHVSTAQANLIKGGLSMKADIRPFKSFGFATNFVVSPFAFGLVATGNGQVSEIIGGGAKSTLWKITKGVTLDAAVLYENRTGAGVWNGRYVGGMLSVNKGF